MTENFVLKLGGHVLLDEAGRIRKTLLSDYINIIAEFWRKGLKLHVVVGGGSIARSYIDVLSSLGVSKAYQDAIGIEVAKLNARLLAYSLRDRGVNAVFASDLQRVSITSNELYVMGGLTPGQSTIAVAALLAEALRALKLIIATDVEGIYTDDPKRNPSAKLLKVISISDLISVLPKEHEPGGYKLIDIVALQIISRSKIPVQVVNGLNPQNVKMAVKGEEVGTLVLPQS